MTRFLIAASAVAMMAACAPAEPQDEATPAAPTPETTEAAPVETAPVEAEFEPFTGSGIVTGADGSEIGTVDVQGSSNGVILRVALNEGALTPGWHGLHLHAVGDCSDVGEFKLSGGHVGKIEDGHGFMNPDGPEGGDLPNIWAAADGSAGYEAFTVLTTGDALLDDDGSALIIHANPDDFITQPIGGAGARVACAVIN